jgi:hypothetical protein
MLSALVDGELAPDALAEVRRALLADAEPRRTLTEHLSIRMLIKSLPLAVPPPSLRQELLFPDSELVRSLTEILHVLSPSDALSTTSDKELALELLQTAARAIRNLPVAVRGGDARQRRRFATRMRRAAEGLVELEQAIFAPKQGETLPYLRDLFTKYLEAALTGTWDTFVQGSGGPGPMEHLISFTDGVRRSFIPRWLAGMSLYVALPRLAEALGVPLLDASARELYSQVGVVALLLPVISPFVPPNSIGELVKALISRFVGGQK